MNTQKQRQKESRAKESKLKFLILHNDEVNSFDFVIETLQEICGHTIEQAEQCTLIAHYNGQCDIKTGTLSELKVLKQLFSDKSLTTTIE